MSESSYTLVQTLQEPGEKLNEHSIVSQTLYQDETLKVTLFRFAIGQELSEHSSSKAAIIQILSGEALLGLGADERKVSAGSWVHMDAHLSHSIKALTPLTMLLTILKSSSANA